MIELDRRRRGLRQGPGVGTETKCSQQTGGKYPNSPFALCYQEYPLPILNACGNAPLAQRLSPGESNYNRNFRSCRGKNPIPHVGRMARAEEAQDICPLQSSCHGHVSGGSPSNGPEFQFVLVCLALIECPPCFGRKPTTICVCPTLRASVRRLALAF